MKSKTMDLMNANYLSRKCDNNNVYRSTLGDIEKIIIDAYIKNPHTEEEVNNFEANLYGNSSMFDDDIHKSVDNVYPYWDVAKTNIQTYSYDTEQSLGRTI